MLSLSWIEKQVLSLPLAELKQVLKRQRLRVSRQQLLLYVMALVKQHTSLRHFKAIHQQEPCGVDYAGFMYGMGLASPILAYLEEAFRVQHGVEFDQLSIADSSLLPCKEEKSITQKDWDKGRVTTRQGDNGVYRICGEKLFGLLNSKKQLVRAELMQSINSPDDHVFKQPYYWCSRGLKEGFLLIDRGFGNNKVTAGFSSLRKTLPTFTAKPIFPPRKRQKWVLTSEERLLYKKRWQIEEVFRQMKDPMGPYRLILKGVRRGKIRRAKVAIATLLWNFAHL